MKLSVGQALGTVLNIQVAEIRNPRTDSIESWFVIRDPSGDTVLDTGLGLVEGEGSITLDQAVWKAVEITSFSQQCHYAIFPIGSDREDIYMAIERELLRQEQTPEFEGKKMWEMLPQGDPRPLVEHIMLQLRECAVNVVHPVLFQTALLRVCCLGVSCMQWVSDWIGRLNVKAATLRAHTPEPPKVVEFTPPPDQGPGNDLKGTVEPVPPLFGAGGLNVVKTDELQEEKKPRKKLKGRKEVDSGFDDKEGK